MNTLDLLRDLIAFPTASANPNRALIDYCANILDDAGAHVTMIADDTAQKANLFATIGPETSGGVMLSGHTDVVPVDGQDWTFPPFEATISNGNVYGRGTADMKGFVAAALRAAVLAGSTELKTPLHLALSYDEEIGCIGVRSLIQMLTQAPYRPRFCIVGEPTSLGVATGHKGKTAFQVSCHGQEAHSALAPTGLNAIYMAADMISAIRRLQDDVIAGSTMDEAYDVQHTTLHVGTISGGTALNIVPNAAQFVAEIRNLVSDDPANLLNTLRAQAQRLIAPLSDQFPKARIDIEVTNTYPPLATAKDDTVVDFVKSLTGANSTMKVAFGTEGGLFARDLHVPTVICGPGSMAQGHKPDEFISVAQLDLCDAMLDTLIGRLKTGI